MIVNDLIDHDLYGPVIRRSREVGARRLVVLLMTEIFGPLPGWVEERLDALTFPELEEIAVRLLKPCALDELLR